MGTRPARPGGLVLAAGPEPVTGSRALAAVAEAFGVRARHVRLVTGSTSRDKVVEIEGPVAGAAARLAELLAS